MEIKFTKKTGLVDSNEWQTVMEKQEGSDESIPVDKLVAIKVQQNDVLLEDGTNSFLLPIGQAEVKCEELFEMQGEKKVSLGKFIMVYQTGQLLKKYNWAKNTFLPAAKTPEDLARWVCSEEYLNINQ